MDKKTAICFILALFLLGGLIFSLGSSGINRGLIRSAEAEQVKLSEVTRDIESKSSSIMGNLKSEPELFSQRNLSTEWPKQVEQSQSLLIEAGREVTSAMALIEKNDPKDESQIRVHLSKAQSLRDRAQRTVTEIQQTSDKWVTYKKNYNKKLLESKGIYDKIIGASFVDLESQIQKAVTDWPKKKQFLEDRLSAVKATVDRAKQNWENSASYRSKTASELTPADFEKMIALGNALNTDYRNITGTQNSLPKLIDQLYWSWDKTLIDMEIKEGYEVDFYLTYRISRTKYVPVTVNESGEANTGPPAETKSDTSVSKVNSSTYKKMEKHIGMVVEHKPAGKFDKEAERTIQPPGYAYMCPPEQKRNKYGYWQTRSNGTSFWVFYGQYALMRDMLWGRSYSNWVEPRSYRDYSRSRSLGRTYYGTDSSNKPRFGKGGSFTSSRYQGSKYVKSGGYKSSQYVKSGGSYKGSKYTTRSRSSSSSRSSSYTGRSRSSFGSSSSRSSFGSSRSRSSSFGGSRFGGGK